jgi:hypothetical protein
MLFRIHAVVRAGAAKAAIAGPISHSSGVP